ncbi:MAG: protein kinase [Polyangiaceae bacterium]|nr:protein kinase [Polyangiaceae bacterium]
MTPFDDDDDDDDELVDTTFPKRREGRGRSPGAESSPAPVDPASGSLGTPISLDRYLLRRQLGKGAMGEVHLCKDGRIGRDVAMKVILPLAQSDNQARARFIREARVQGQLEHPSIVPVYDLGIDPSGAIFFTMKYLRGMTLAQVIRGLRHKDQEIVKHYSRRRLVSAFASVCLAVDFAHARGVVHRDLKPSNIMLGDFGEVYVLDWGIAKLKEPEPDRGIAVEDSLEEDVQTAAGKILGTFGYMAPEQALGRGAALDKRSDVYSLGAILFELLTLEPLIPKSTWNEMLRTTLKGAVAKASERAPDKDVPPELEAICVKATRLDASERYASARELHEAVERYLDGDRDVEVRSQLALKFARAADEAAMKSIFGGPDSEDARREALREVARALALDPANAEAMRALQRIVTELPAKEPSEVKAEVDAATSARRRLQLRDGAVANMAGTALIVPFGLWMGVRDAAIVGGTVLFTLAAAAIQVFASRLEGKRSTHGFVFAAYVCNVGACALIGRAFGPLFVMPMLLALLSFAYCMSHAARYRLAILVTGACVLLGSVGLELSGFISPSYLFRDGAITVLPNSVMLPKGPTIGALVVASLFLAVAPGVIMGRLQDALKEAEKKSAMHVWHLKQLLPDQTKTPARRN